MAWVARHEAGELAHAKAMRRHQALGLLLANPLNSPGQVPWPMLKHAAAEENTEQVSEMKQIRVRPQKTRREPWWSYIDTRTPSGRVLPY